MRAVGRHISFFQDSLIHTVRLIRHPDAQSGPALQLLRLRQFSSSGDETNSAGISNLWRVLTGQQDTNNGQGDAQVEDENSSSLVPASPEIRYREVLAVPLPRRPLFPGGIMPVTVQNNKLIKELIEIKRQGAQAYVGAFLKKEPDSKQPSPNDGTYPFPDDLLGTSDNPSDGSETPSAQALHAVGTFAQVHTIAPHEAGAQLLLLGHRRIRWTDVRSLDPLCLSILHLKDSSYDAQDMTLKATTMEVISTLKELLHMHPLYNEQMRNFIQFGADFHDLSRLADLAASLTSGDAASLQMVLEELSVPERASQSLLLLKKEVELCRLQADIGKRVEEKISKDQRKYFLMEQLRSIKKELGLEKDEKTTLIQKFRERLAPLAESVPEGVASVIEEEMEKLSALEPASSEFSVTRNYLDWLTSIPWGKTSEERLDVAAAREVLDEDHYGLEDVKARILEFIAVGRLRGGTQGKILCLVGPPGVGKTSIGRSIARALNRQYYRFSVGGLSDVAEIKGHRRTYVGAMPGKMVQCLKTAGTINPFVLIDEIDKLGRGWQGDPASALLELLDPEQNSSFSDHYLDVPVDLGKVLFMCTANVLDTIPGPLLDRMEVIRLSGYTAAEKLAISRRYLEPQARHDAGVPKGAVEVSQEALMTLVEDYAREAGVRNLKKQLEKIYRKAALQLVESGEDVVETIKRQNEREKGILVESESPTRVFEGPEVETRIHVGVEDLKEYVGQPPFPSDKMYEHGTPAGVVMGLAWTAMGGSTLYIEAAAVEKGQGKGGLKTTGQLGDVMKESATIAHALARRYYEVRHPHMEDFFSEHALHVHVPAGATPKDGPSAGVTLVTALLSLASDKPVQPDVAMTGEVTLTGMVLPVGGIKEKTLAAKRAGVKRVIFPEGNRRDWEELGDDVKSGLEAYFVEKYDQVYDLAFEAQ